MDLQYYEDKKEISNLPILKKKVHILQDKNQAYVKQNTIYHVDDHFISRKDLISPTLKHRKQGYKVIRYQTKKMKLLQIEVIMEMID